MLAAIPELGCAFLDVPGAGARLWASWSSRGLRKLRWAQAGAPAESVLGREHVPEAPLPDRYASSLQAYLDGSEVEPAGLPVDLLGTPFQLKVWNALRRIPRGAVRSYQGIANDVGAPRATRAVGAANGRNPIAIVVPCHRVVQSGMKLGGYAGGVELKRFLLALEGVVVHGDAVQPGQLALIPE